ncbi:MAG: hypothetical protein IIT99_05750, partial [Bacteroidales bacterium]|nr:hypothetical protein [Bacteroidales bacterium]
MEATLFAAEVWLAWDGAPAERPAGSSARWARGAWLAPRDAERSVAWDALVSLSVDEKKKSLGCAMEFQSGMAMRLRDGFEPFCAPDAFSA